MFERFRVSNRRRRNLRKLLQRFTLTLGSPSWNTVCLPLLSSLRLDAVWLNQTCRAWPGRIPELLRPAHGIKHSFDLSVFFCGARGAPSIMKTKPSTHLQKMHTARDSILTPPGYHGDKKHYLLSGGNHDNAAFRTAWPGNKCRNHKSAKKKERRRIGCGEHWRMTSYFTRDVFVLECQAAGWMLASLLCSLKRFVL